MTIITKEKIEELKAKHGDVLVLEVDMNESAEVDMEGSSKLEVYKNNGDFKDGVYVAVLKNPEKRAKALAMTGKDPVQSGNIILKNSILEADPEIMDNDDVNITAALYVMKALQIGKGSLKKY